MIQEILEILNNYFPDYAHFHVAVFLHNESAHTKEEIGNYIESHKIIILSDHQLNVDDTIYEVYNEDEVDSIVHDIEDSMYNEILNILGVDKIHYFDFSQYLEDNYLSIEDMLECNSYEIVYDMKDCYYIAEC